jgi:hypothetical protein
LCSEEEEKEENIISLYLAFGLGEAEGKTPCGAFVAIFGRRREMCSVKKRSWKVQRIYIQPST